MRLAAEVLETQSPWGLLDVAGGTMEWTESVITGTGGIMWRIQDGSRWGSHPSDGVGDALYSRAGEFPNGDFGDFGFRIASSVPAPSSMLAWKPCVPDGAATSERLIGQIVKHGGQPGEARTIRSAPWG